MQYYQHPFHLPAGRCLHINAAVGQGPVKRHTKARRCITARQCVLLREALETDYSWRQLRLMFALSPWDRPMQYGQQAADEMQAKEALFKNFFQNVAVVMRRHSTAHTSKWAVSCLLLRSVVPDQLPSFDELTAAAEPLHCMRPLWELCTPCSAPSIWIHKL